VRMQSAVRPRHACRVNDQRLFNLIAMRLRTQWLHDWHVRQHHANDLVECHPPLCNSSAVGIVRREESQHANRLVDVYFARNIAFDGLMSVRGRTEAGERQNRRAGCGCCGQVRWVGRGAGGDERGTHGPEVRPGAVADVGRGGGDERGGLDEPARAMSALI